MRTKTLLKYIVIMLIFIVSSFSSTAQDSTTIKIAIPISLEYPDPLYSMFFTSDTSFYATVYEGDHEFVRQFSFENGLIKDEGLVIPDSGVAIGGQINGRPYLYLQYKGDVTPGYPDDSPFSFTSHSEEVFVAGYMENQLVIVKENGKLNLCRAIGNGDRVRYEKIKISDKKKDENGIHIIGDSLYFSRVDKTGFYKLHKSVYDHEKKGWGDPIIMPAPYNIEGTNTLFALWYEGIWYISSDRAGILTIYAIGSMKRLIAKLDIKQIVEEVVDLSLDEEEGKLKIKLRDGTQYEINVSPNGYAFYNSMVDLVEEMREDDEVKRDSVVTVYLIDSEVDETDELIQIVDSFSINGNKCYAAYLGKTGVTLVPRHFAEERGYKSTPIQEKNLESDDDAFLLNYVAIWHTLVPPDEELITENLLTDNSDAGFNTNTRSSDEIKIIADLEDAIKEKREFTEEELLNIFGLENDTCYVQVGFYKGRQPNTVFWNVFRGNYIVLPSDRFIEGIKVGTQYTIDLNLKKALIALTYTIDNFKANKIKDKPFIRIGKWEEKYSLVKLVNGKYVISKYVIKQ